MAGVVAYLGGPGKHNEHTDQHVIGGDPALVARFGFAALSGPEGQVVGRELAKYLDGPRRVFGTEVPYTRTTRDPVSGEVTQEQAAGHVWHCSLSLPAEDGKLTDATWEKIANDFIDRMGFSDTEAAQCRWVAVRHGLSAKGNDHVHLAVSLVRDDGTKASVWQDRPRAQTACRELEVEYGLTRLDSRSLGAGTRGYSQAEIVRAGRFGDRVPERVQLERTVRAIAAGSESERTFVGGLREAGLLVRARWAGDVPVGYSVAVDRSQDGAAPIWFGGGSLARDLTLARLQRGWPAEDPGRLSAFASANPAERPVFTAREEAFSRPWTSAADRVDAAAVRLAGVPASSTSEWVGACRDLSGAFSAWARRVEGDGVGPLTDTARELSRLATTHATDRPHTPPASAAATAGSGGRLATDVALLLQVAAGNTSSRQFEALLAMQLGRMLDAVLQWQRENSLLSQATATSQAWERAQAGYIRELGTPIDVRDSADERWTVRVQQLLGQGMTADAAEEQAAAERTAAERTARSPSTTAPPTATPSGTPPTQAPREPRRGFGRS